VAEDVWSRATAGAPDRDAIFDREMFAADFDSTTAEQLVEEDARRYSPRRRAVNE
jgi:methylaspartate ammonia-lyase